MSKPNKNQFPDDKKMVSLDVYLSNKEFTDTLCKGLKEQTEIMKKARQPDETEKLMNSPGFIEHAEKEAEELRKHPEKFVNLSDEYSDLIKPDAVKENMSKIRDLVNEYANIPSWETKHMSFDEIDIAQLKSALEAIVIYLEEKEKK